MRQAKPTLELIEDSAFALLGRDASASLSQIAAHAGIGRATLHRYFATRDALFEHLAALALKELDDVAEMAAAEATDHGDALFRIMRAIIPLADRQMFLSQDPAQLSASLRSETERQLAEMHALIDAAKADGSLETSHPTLWIAEVFEALVYAAWTSIRNEDATPRQATELAWVTFVNGIAGAIKS